MAKIEIVSTCPICGSSTWTAVEDRDTYRCCLCGEECELDQMSAGTRHISGEDAPNPVPYIDRVIAVIEGCGWKCKRDEENAKLTITEMHYTFGDYQFQISLDDNIRASIFRHFQGFSTGSYLSAPSNSRNSYDVKRNEAWTIKQLLRILVNTVDAIPREDVPMRFWMYAGVSFMLTEEEFNEVANGGPNAVSIIREQTTSRQIVLDGDSYAPENIRDFSEGKVWRHGEVNYDFTPDDLLPWLESKRFWMRAGISMDLTAMEFAKVIRGSKEGEDIIRDRINTGKYTLDGESYSPANMNETSENVWQHEELHFEFDPVAF